MNWIDITKELPAAGTKVVVLAYHEDGDIPDPVPRVTWYRDGEWSEPLFKPTSVWKPRYWASIPEEIA